MKMKKIFIISVILMFLLIPVTYADDGDYEIPHAIKDINVQDDGSVIISEQISYDIDGSINGVYREIPLLNNQSITNISVSTPGYYNTLEVIDENGKTKIKVWLYKDSQKTQKTYDAKVTVTYNYTFNKGVKIYNDIAELQYMTWGDEWDSSVDNLESYIHIPGSNQDTEYWNNPDDYVVSTEWTSDNTLTTISENIPSNTLYEQRLLMPKSYFKSTENAEVITIDAKAKIEADQKQYEKDREFQNTLLQISSVILGILMIIPLGIYGLFGREPKISYDAEYEYDLPTDATPIQINSIVIGDVDDITDDALYATILDLINRNYFKIISSNEDDTIIRFNQQNTSMLKRYELSLINYLNKFAINGDISLKSIGDTEDPSSYRNFKTSWVMEAKQEVPDTLIKRYFNDKGSTIFKAFSYILLALSIIGMTSFLFLSIPNNFKWIIMGLSVILFIESIIMICIPNTFAGRWTPEGKEFHDKWKNFEKYLTDFSLIKERPPASIQVWGKYLIYAAALGCADEVSKNMKEYFDLGGVTGNYINDSNVVLFAYYGGFNHMESSLSSLIQTDSGSGGIGSVGGGGFGGGGGGTF